MKPKKIDIGCEAIDSISGFRGTVIAIIEYLYGEGRIGIQPKGLHEGKPIETQWFPYEQCTHADNCCLTPGELARRDRLAELNAIIKFIEHDCNANADTDIGECFRALIESISHGYHEKYLAKDEPPETEAPKEDGIQEKTCVACKYETTPYFQYPCYECSGPNNHALWEPKEK